MIRTFDLNDIEKLIPLIEEHFYAAHADKRMNTFKRETAKQSLLSALNTSVCFVNEDGNDIDGVIMYTFFPSLFDDTQLRATERLWYAKSGKVMIKLHREMIDFIKKNVDVISIGVPVDNSTKDFLIRDGFEVTDLILSKKGGR